MSREIALLDNGRHEMMLVGDSLLDAWPNLTFQELLLKASSYIRPVASTSTFSEADE